MSRCSSPGQSTLLTLAAIVVLSLFVPSGALAAFTRPFVRQLTGTSGGAFTSLGGVAVDGEDKLWVGDGHEANRLDGFGPAGSGNAFLTALPIEAVSFPEDVAIEGAADHFLVTGRTVNNEIDHFMEIFDGTGKLVESWTDHFAEPARVAVDNSTNLLEDTSSCSPSCVVYVTHGTDLGAPLGDGFPPGVNKLNAKGEPTNFVNAKGEPVDLPYVKGNEITGTPTGPGGCEDSFRELEAVTVDPEGDIYVADHECANNRAALLEYRPSGEFIRLFTGEETPGLGEGEDSREEGGFGGDPVGLAFDPVSGHLLVAVASKRQSASGNLGAVDEFDPVSGRFVDQIVESAEGARLHKLSEIAVDSQGYLYAADQTQGAVDVYGPGHFLPSLKLAEAGERGRASAVLSGSVDPEGLPLSECYFQYVSEEAFQEAGFADLSSGGVSQCAPAAGAIPANTQVNAVHADVTGLTTGITYRFRLVAKSEGALGGVAQTASLAFTAQDAPRVDATFAGNLSSTFADLYARIAPCGADTTYHFEYDTTPYASGARHGLDAPVPDAAIGSGGATGSSDASVAQQIGGLAPGTVYYFRVVAENTIEGENEITYGPQETFSTLQQSVPGLPDNRAYELVSPVDKGSSEDMFAQGLVNHEIVNSDVGYVADSGEAFLLETNAAFGADPASSHNVYVFRREARAGRWGMTPLASASGGVQGLINPIFDPFDLSRVAFGDQFGSLPSSDGLSLSDLVGSPGGPYATLHTDLPVYGLHENARETTTIAGASRAVGSVVLESTSLALATGAESQDEGSHELYQWTGGYENVNGEVKPELELVNVDSEGEPVSRCGATLGFDQENSHNAVSTDGSRIIFTAPDPEARNLGPGCWNGATSKVPQLYMRVGGQTVELSAPEEGWTPEGPVEPVIYVGASEDGSRVFFATKTQLTSDDAGIHDFELYECEILEEEAGKPSCKLTRVSAGESHSAAANLWTVPAISANGDAVYFTAYGALAPGAQALTRPPAEEDKPVNVYRYDAATRTTTYVGAVVDREAAQFRPESWVGPVVGASAGALIPVQSVSWYTTPDGRYLLFATSSEIKPDYSTIGPCREFPGVANGQGDNHCEELYRYDSERPVSEGAAGVSDNPVCISCNPSGAPPVSHSLFSRSRLQSDATGQVRGMSDDGSYVFFDSTDALVPQDINGTLDVYEWHEDLVSHQTRISLISSGEDSAPSFFLGMDTPGSNVFIGTHARLTPQDTDTAGDVYDVRICTAGDPCITPPAGETAQCEGEACHNPVPAPIDTTPSSLAFAGAGNLAPPSTLVVKPKSLTRARQLAKALRACARKPKLKRARCRAQAQKRYGTSAKKTAHARHATTSGRVGR
jgi:hypothetical protein